MVEAKMYLGAFWHVVGGFMTRSRRNETQNGNENLENFDESGGIYLKTEMCRQHNLI